MADFKFACPNCGQRIQATDAYTGMQIACPACQKTLTVPQAPGAPAKPMIAQTIQPAAPQKFTPAPPAKAAKSRAKWALIGGISAVVVVGAVAFILFNRGKSEDDSGSADGKKSSSSQEAKAGGSGKEGQNPKAAEIMQKVSDLYDSMTSYSASGKSVSLIDMSKVDLSKMPGMDKLPASQRNSKEVKAAMSKPQRAEADFTLKLGKPDLYLVEWDQHAGPATMKGAVWAAGDGDYVMMGSLKKYAKMTNQEMALATATGISGGAAGTMPGIFFKNQFNLLSHFNNAKLGKDENIDGEDCYVVTGKTMGLKMILWINKSSYLIKQKQQVLGGELEMSSEDDQKMKEGLKQMGDSAPSEKQAKEMMKGLKAMASKMKGTITETYENIEINKPVAKGDFNYSVPDGVKLSSKLF